MRWDLWNKISDPGVYSTTLFNNFKINYETNKKTNEYFTSIIDSREIVQAFEMSKKEIIESGIKLGIDYSQTHSCYDPVIKNGEIIACKECDSCRLRLDGFNAANTSDPIKYA